MQWILIIGTSFLAGLCIYLFCHIRRQRQYIEISNRIHDELFRNVAAYVLLIDPDFNVLQTNYYTLTGRAPLAQPPKVGNLLLCKNGEDAGMCGTHDLCDACPIRASINTAFHSKKSFMGLEAPLTLYSSNTRTTTVSCYVSISGNYLTIAEEDRMVLTVTDITAQKRSQQELDEARMRAEESDRMKSIFLANTSHELRTPLSAIIGFSELLMSDPTPDENQEYMHIIRSNSEVLLQLINDLLDLSKIETGTLDYEYTEVELNTVMAELEGSFRARQSENSPVIITFHRQHPDSYIRTDRKRLVQVIANFLSNAMKFTVKGSIDFGYEIRDSNFYIYVSDTGTGITKEHQRQLFDRFVKAGSFKQGIGIGLAISKSIVETLGGAIGVESQPNKGSTFWFTLPRWPQE